VNALTGPGVGSSRGALWLPLLRRLAEEVPNSYVWKNVDPALEGIGDIDYCARTADWPTINLVFRRWALNAGLGPVIVCRHVPDVMFLVVPDSTSDSLYELDVRDRIKLRGTTVFHCEEGLPLAQTDARGFRRLRPGAEGVVKLVLHGVAPGGLARPAALDKERVAMLIKSDPRGARDATRLFGMASPSTQSRQGGHEGRMEPARDDARGHAHDGESARQSQGRLGKGSLRADQEPLSRHHRDRAAQASRAR